MQVKKDGISIQSFLFLFLNNSAAEEIEYSSNTIGTTVFRIFDVTGKKVLKILRMVETKEIIFLH